MNIRKKKQKHIKECGQAYKPTLRKTIRQLLKMFARRSQVFTNRKERCSEE